MTEGFTEGIADGITDLHALGEQLLETARAHSEGRASNVVEHGPHQRAVLMALAGGTGLQEHSSPLAATFHVLSGRARLRAGERVWEVETGQLVPIPPERHSVETDEDTVILLTVALG
jgi:quercetin dioxygenase-like cupin family protein